jgi:hypothetical protein
MYCFITANIRPLYAEIQLQGYKSVLSFSFASVHLADGINIRHDGPYPKRTGYAFNSQDLQADARLYKIESQNRRFP